METLLEKANQLGISDADSFTEEQLRREVYYASLSIDARNDLERGQVSRVGFNRTTLPEPMVVKRRVRV